MTRELREPMTLRGARLRIATGDGDGRSEPLADRRVTIGRGDDADIRIDDHGASKQHAALFPGDGGWTVEDLGSRNGTLVDGARLAGQRRLATGDRIRIGATELEFLAGDGDARLVRADGGDLPLVGERSVVGRAGSGPDLPDIVLLDEKASRAHAAIAHGADGWTITDLGSRNGTHLDGERIPADAPAALRDGALIVIGRTRLRFAAGAAATDDDRGRASAPRGARPDDARTEPETARVPRPAASGADPDASSDDAEADGAAADGADIDRPDTVDAAVAPPERREPGTSRTGRQRQPTVDARAVVREFGLPRPVLIGAAALAVAVILIVFVVPAIDRALNGDARDGGASTRSATPAPAPVRTPAPVGQRSAPPSAPDAAAAVASALAATAAARSPERALPASEPIGIAPRGVDRPPVDAAAPVDAGPQPRATLATPPPPSADARAPALAPALVVATWIGSGPVALARSAKGSIAARTRDAVAVYDASGAHGALATIDADAATTAATPAEVDDEPLTLRADGATWRFASPDREPSAPIGVAGGARWWHPTVPCADAARPIGAWPAPDGLVLTAWRVAGGDSLAARDPRDAQRPDAALAEGWTATTTGEATLLLLADAGGAPHAATYLPGPPTALAVDAWGRVYVARRLGEPTEALGLGGSAGVSVLSADLRRVVATWALGAADGGADEALTAVVVGDGVLAAGGATGGRQLGITANAVQAQSSGAAPHGFAAILRLW